MVRIRICRGRLEDGSRCPNPTGEPSGICPGPHQAGKAGFGARFRRTPSHPVHRTHRWRALARRTVDRWVRVHGWACPGWRRPPHTVEPGDLAAAHPFGLAVGGDAFPRDLGVLCSSCNARQSLSERAR
ncbi:hypothetical protein BH23CHL8_BH23CHL8_31950 [soil metagenome]